MNNKLKLYLLLIFMPAIFLVSCSKFADKYINNPDPHVNSTGNTAQLLANSLWASFNANGLVYGNNQTAYYVQYISDDAYPSTSLYSTGVNDWANYYAGPLNDLHYIIDYNTGTPGAANVVGNGSNKNQIATARIWRAYLLSIVTDLYGNIPYSEANLQNFTPKYDKQKDIYTDILKELTEAVDQFDGGAVVKGDIIFSGDITQWKKFANSLRMVLSLRLSNVDPAFAKTQFQAAYSHSAGYISTNQESAFFPYQNDINFNNPWYALFFQGNKIGISSFIVTTLANNADPRLDSMISLDNAGAITGVDYGMNIDKISAFNAAHTDGISGFSTQFTNWDSKGYFLTASQMMLTRAEAGLLGWISGTTPKNDYNTAITLSCNQLGISDPSLITNLLATPDVEYGTSTNYTPIQQIAVQKYIALFPNSIEAYSEWRRTGYPKLTPAPNAVNPSKQIPRRYGYPLLESTLNTASNAAALNLMDGTNSTDNRVWWDKN